MKFHSIQFLVDHLLTFGDRPAIGLRQSLGARWWSYQRLHKAIHWFSAQLERWSIPSGSRVLIWAPNCPEWVATLLGALHQGMVVVPVDEAASRNLVEQIVRDVHPALVIHGPDQDVTGLNMLKCAIYSLTTNTHLAEVRKPSPAVQPDDPALIIYTSGTTQNPKGVVLTHRNVLSQVELFKRWVWFLRVIPVRQLALSPMSHIQGLMLGAMIPLSIGLSVLYSDSVEPQHVIRTIRQNRITILLAVPRVQHVLADTLRNLPTGRRMETLAEMMNRIRSFPMRRHFSFLATHAHLGYSFWVLLVGGADLPAADERFWYECGYVLVQGYGLTETAALVSLKINGPFFTRLGSIGKPIGNQKVRLNDKGELFVKGDNVSPGYYKQDETDRSTFQNGYLRTGDLIRQDQQKRLYFVGRVKEAIVTGEGHNVYPQDVEKVLLERPGVRDAVVVSLSESGTTEAHPVLLLGDDIEPALVIAETNRFLEPHQKLRSWTVWPEEDFPRTGLMKVRRKLVAQQVHELRKTQPETQSEKGSEISLEEIQATSDRQRRIALLARYLVHEPVDSQTERSLPLVEAFGLSSLDVVELSVQLEQVRPASLGRLPLKPTSNLADIRSVLNETIRPRHTSPLPEQGPFWSSTILGRLIRSLSQPFLIGLWTSFSVKVQTISEVDPIDIRTPHMIAAAPHRNWLDGFVIYGGLPAHMRKRLVTVTNRDFSEIFDPSSRTMRRTQVEVWLAYYLLWPLVFDFVIVPNFGSTRMGLYHLGEYIDQGFSPVTFPKGLAPPGRENPRHEPGMAMMASQTGLPILPVWIQGNDHLQVSPRRPIGHVTIRIGEPVAARPDKTISQIVDQVETRFQHLEALTRVPE